MRRYFVFVLLLFGAMLAGPGPAAAAAQWPDAQTLRPFAVCADFPNQAAAQAAANTRDGDGDGIYCEALPCPCAGPGGGGSGGSGGSGGGSGGSGGSSKSECVRPDKTVELWFSRERYPNVYRHVRQALRRGWPSILAVYRTGPNARRERLLENIPTKAGYDRDEYPPAIGRGGYRKPLKRGVNPTGWRASVMYVPASENRSHGAVMGNKLRPYCNGTFFRFRWS